MLLISQAADCILQLVVIAKCNEDTKRYRVNRTGTGGCWELPFSATYAMHRVSTMVVMPSSIFNCVLILIDIRESVEALIMLSKKGSFVRLEIYDNSLLKVRLI